MRFFKGYFILSASLILWTLVCISWMGLKANYAHRRYKNFLKNVHNHAQIDHYETTHQREMISKMYWLLSRKGATARLAMHADHSELTLELENKHHRLHETLHQLEGVLQEKQLMENGEPWQLVRSIQTDIGYYDYDRQVLETDEVQLAQYKLPGHTLPTSSLLLENPIMEGHAKSARIKLKHHSIELDADQLKAHITGGSND